MEKPVYELFLIHLNVETEEGEVSYLKIMQYFIPSQFKSPFISPNIIIS